MKNKALHNLLNQLNLVETQAVFFTNEENGAVYKYFTSEVQNKISILNPDAIFVFNNLPFILFFDLTNRSAKDEVKIHQQVWSFNHSPVVFIIKGADIMVYNAFAYTKEHGLELISNSIDQITQKFSFWNLQSGRTWKWIEKEFYDKARQKRNKRVNQKLFENIKQVRDVLTQKLQEDHANTLILRLIFIRYLIDRGIEIENRLIKGETILEKRASFSKLIANPKLLGYLFDLLNDNFNGVLFKNHHIQLSEKQALSLAKVFRGEQAEIGSLFFGTDFYFEVFDFSIIPVEVISGIYESIIDNETKDLQSAIYTPSFLVDYILKDTVDDFLAKNNGYQCRIFDPSAGSGIFLSQSLRKMIEKYKKISGDKTQKEFSEGIREIAKNNLFGIDINLQAIKITCFSIYIILLDYQKPKDISKYQFPPLLNENFFEANFFDKKHSYNNTIKSLDFILGNPPWKSNKDSIHLSWLKSNNKSTGRYELAQSFLLRSKDFMASKTKAALVVTSTIFYNTSSTTKKFKQEFLTSFCMKKFLDLSAVRKLIFEEKKTPASVVYYNISTGEKHLSNIVNHQSVKANIFLKNYQTLVIEKFDVKKIAQKLFIDNDWMFKVALYGNILDYRLLKKLGLIQNKLKDFLKKNEIAYGDGIKSNKGDDFARHLIGLPIVENAEVNSYYTPISNKRQLSPEEVYYESGRKPKLFKGKHILIKAQAAKETEIKFSYTNGPTAFKSDVFGFAAKDGDALKYIYSFLLSDLYSYYQFLVSSLGIASRAKIRLKEHLSFPLLTPTKKVKEEIIQLVDQFLKPFHDFYESDFNLGLPFKDENLISKNNRIVNSIYNLSPHEIDLISYTLNVSRYQFQEYKQSQFTRKVNADKSFLEQYASVYLEEFSRIYTDEFLQVEIYPLGYFIAINFVFHLEKPAKQIIFPANNQEEKTVLNFLAQNLSITKITDTSDASKNLYIQKDIKGFEKNSFYIIKPNEYKCWHRAMAWYDVAEFKEKIELAELQCINKNLNGI